MLDPNGLKTAIAGAITDAQSMPGDGAAEQLSLLCEGGTSQPAAENGVPDVRGPGRPPGSSNKSTKEWQQFLLSRYRSPLVGLAEISSMDLQDLAKMLGLKCDLNYEKALELLKLQVGCMNALAPYVHQKMPTAIDAGEAGLIQLVIHGAEGQKQTVAPEPIDIEYVPYETMENQSLSDKENANSVVSDSVAN